MSQFFVIEGGDGAGKSHLANRIEQHLTSVGRQDVVVILKDQDYDQDSWSGRRLQAMHQISWAYDKKEPVWEYSRGYWLYSLMAWYTLFYEKQVLPAIDSGAVVLTDGWYFKHQARFHVPQVNALVRRLADQLFGTLPKPDAVFWLDTPEEVAATRRLGTSKPTEHGAFDTGSGSLDPEHLVTYQATTKQELWGVLRDSGCVVHRTSYLISPEEVLGLIDRTRRESV